MSTEQHESLKQAEWLEVYALTPRDKEVAAMLRSSHALIVQMAEALSNSHTMCHFYGLYENPHGKTVSFASVQAIAAATQYLKGPKT